MSHDYDRSKLSVSRHFVVARKLYDVQVMLTQLSISARFRGMDARVAREAHNAAASVEQIRFGMDNDLVTDYPNEWCPWIYACGTIHEWSMHMGNCDKCKKAWLQSEVEEVTGTADGKDPNES